jgi:dihydroorotate dehydrogenase
VTFPSPIGLAAGFDKDAAGVRQLGALGFGFVEVGTVTPRPQPGNPRPRLFRLPADGALLNRMGFNSGGAAAAERALRRRRGDPTVVGVNVGKNKDTPSERAAEDFAAATRALAPHAGYVAVNVSSPNTPGLRDLQAVAALRPLLAAVQGEAAGRPVLVKIAPDLSDEDVDAVADLALELGLAGIIATNTTVSRQGLATPPAEVEAAGAGGLSGAPLRERSLEVLRRLHARTGGQITLVAAGGVRNADDAWERLAAGATLVELYTGFVYGGPATPWTIVRGLAARARSEGYERLQDGLQQST